ncbi:MAG: hypothetical protein AMS17_20880 [Spirochaetes bacterium DG_61]|nr:MAG: hypothetical protein AMS17_20880 [Spirochaetes bacterium DG_61]
MKDSPSEKKLLIPVLHFKYFGRVLNNEISLFMKDQFDIPKSRIINALKNADRTQTAFEREIEKRGQKLLNDLPEDQQAMVIIGRPYNTNDPELNLHLVEKLKNLDVLPIPIDFLPLSRENIWDDYPMMYWPNGRNESPIYSLK